MKECKEKERERERNWGTREAGLNVCQVQPKAVKEAFIVSTVNSCNCRYMPCISVPLFGQHTAYTWLKMIPSVFLMHIFLYSFFPSFLCHMSATFTCFSLFVFFAVVPTLSTFPARSHFNSTPQTEQFKAKLENQCVSCG